MNDTKESIQFEKGGKHGNTKLNGTRYYFKAYNINVCIRLNRRNLYMHTRGRVSFEFISLTMNIHNKAVFQANFRELWIGSFA